jgi:hypothetical protein
VPRQEIPWLGNQAGNESRHVWKKRCESNKHLTSANTIKRHQTPSNVIKHHQTSSNIIKDQTKGFPFKQRVKGFTSSKPWNI